MAAICKLPEGKLHETDVVFENPIPSDGQIYDYKFVKEVSLKQICYVMCLIYSAAIKFLIFLLP